MTAVSSRPSSATATRPATGTPGWLLAVWAWFASRLALGVVVWAGNTLLATSLTVVDVAVLWDGAWYLSAAEGYQTAVAPPGEPTGQINIAFFPVLPLILRAVSAVTGLSFEVAGVVVNLVAGAVAAALIWKVVERCADADTADRAALLFCVFPGTVLLSYVYSEPLMLVFAAGCLLALLNRRWAAAGLLAALATATRPNALALLLPCAWAAVAAIRRRDEWKAVLAPLLAPLGFVAYMGWLAVVTGQPDIWFRVQREGWGEQLDFGRRTLEIVIEALTEPGPLHMTSRLRVAGVAVSVAGAVALWRWRPPAVLWLYAFGVIAMAAAGFTLGPRPRFVITAFPLIAAIAWAVRGRRFQVLLACTGLLSGLVTLLYMLPGYTTP